MCAACAISQPGASNSLTLRLADPSPMHVQVEVAACVICARDIQTSKAGSQAPFAAPPGHEGVGYVSKVGAGGEGIEVGQRVVGGGFARLRDPFPPAIRLMDKEVLICSRWLRTCIPWMRIPTLCGNWWLGKLMAI